VGARTPTRGRAGLALEGARDVRGGAAPAARLPAGQERPGLMALRRPEGWVVAHFSARGAAREAIEQEAWQDHADIGEKEYP
jgi:hypothetical protein